MFVIPGQQSDEESFACCIFFFEDIAKKKYIFIYIYEKEREHFALVVQLSEKKIRFVTLVSKCRRLVYLSSSNNVV